MCVCILLLMAASIFIVEEETEDSASSPPMDQRTVQLEGTVKKSITAKQQILTVGNLQSQFRQHQSKQQKIKEKRQPETGKCVQKRTEKERIVVYDDSFCDIKIGDRIWIQGEGKAFEEARNPEILIREPITGRDRSKDFCGPESFLSQGMRKFQRANACFRSGRKVRRY